MTDLTTIEAIPLETDTDGVIRISKTRVTLDTIVQAFTDGATAEEIAQQYPPVPLADIYSVIGYYLRHSEEVEAYLDQRACRFPLEVPSGEAIFGLMRKRDRLLARQAVGE